MSRGNLQRVRYSKKKALSARKYLTFTLAGQVYGINMFYVREIAGRQNVSPISQVPDYVQGVITKFDETIPVIDLRLRLGLPEAEATGRSCLIIVEIVQRLKITCGLLVDAINEVKSIPAEAIVMEESPEDDFVMGQARSDSETRLLLNIYRVLHPEEIPVIENTHALRVV